MGKDTIQHRLYWYINEHGQVIQALNSEMALFSYGEDLTKYKKQFWLRNVLGTLMKGILFKCLIFYLELKIINANVVRKI
jgi:hypothetical protein